jgi:hypothetical protein
MSSGLAQLSALVGSLLPLLIAIIQRAHWRQGFRTVVGLACIAAASTIIVWSKGQLNAHDWVTSAITVFTLCQVTYHTVWKQTGVTKAIETITTPKGGGS